MNEFIIVFRNPGNGAVGVIAKDDDSGDPAQFKSYNDAIVCAMRHKLLLAWPYQIIELDQI